jgi:hypothetical protein
MRVDPWILVWVAAAWTPFVALSKRMESVVTADPNEQPRARAGSDWFPIVGAPLAVAFGLVALRPLFPPAGDTTAYVRTFVRLPTSPDAWEAGKSYFGNSEFLFWRLQGLLAQWADARMFLVLNFVAVVVATALCYRTLTRHWSPTAWVSFALVFLTYFTVYSGNGMRQALAIPVAVLAARLLWERAWLKGAALLAIAAGLHWAAVVVLAVVALRALPLTRLVVLGIPVAAYLFSTQLSSVVLSRLGETTLSDRADVYGTAIESTADSRTSINLLIVVALYLLLALRQRPVHDGDKFILASALLFMTLVAATLPLNEVWVRFLVNLMFLTPAMAIACLRATSLPPRLRSTALALGFTLLCGAWFMSASAQLTLGYHF